MFCGVHVPYLGFVRDCEKEATVGANDYVFQLGTVCEFVEEGHCLG